MILMIIIHFSDNLLKSLQCVEAFIADFKPKPKYKAAYVYFTDCK